MTTKTTKVKEEKRKEKHKQREREQLVVLSCFHPPERGFLLYMFEFIGKYITKFLYISFPF